MSASIWSPANNGSFAVSVAQCITRDVLKSLDTSSHVTAYLTEVNREGVFVWTLGDFSTHVTADTQEGIYIKANEIASNVGVWVRKTPGDGEWHIDWFEVPDDPAAGAGGVNEILAHTQLTSVINLGNIVKPNKILFGSKIYTLGATLPSINWQVIFEGARGFQGTIIVKRYVEANAFRGILAFNDFGFDCRYITLRAGSGSGGSGISAILTLNSPASGRTYLSGVYISLGAYANYSLVIDGASNTTVSGPSYRGVFISGGEYFGAALAAIRLRSVHHVMFSGVFVTNSGGASSTALEVTGDVNAYSDDIQFTGIIGGRVTLDWLSRSMFTTPMIDNWTVGTNVTSTSRVGHRSGGTLTNNAASGEYVDYYDGSVVAQGGNSTAGWRKWGSGRLQQWGIATTVAGVITGQNFPVSFTSTNINMYGSKSSDSGANIINLSQYLPTSVSQYSAKSMDFNWSSGAYGAAAASVRWVADGV